MGRALSCFYTLEFSLQLRKIMETFSPCRTKVPVAVYSVAFAAFRLAELTGADCLFRQSVRRLPSAVGRYNCRSLHQQNLTRNHGLNRSFYGTGLCSL